MDQPFRLDGRVAIVTGASAGLGVAFSTALADAGADLALMARRADRLAVTASAVEERGRRALVVRGDVALRQDCERAVDAAMAELGRVDVLVNNAGVSDAGPAHHEAPEAFSAVVDVNLAGSFWLASACARVMEPGSSIVNVASVLAERTVPQAPCAGYGATKAALVGLTRHLASQWTPRKGIRVNALVPGWFDTDLSEVVDPELVNHRILAGRWGDPAELAHALVFLATPASSYMTGASLVVDGGFSIA